MELALKNLKIITLGSLKIFIKASLPLIILVVGLSYLYFTSIKETNINALKKNELLRIQLQNEAFRDEFKNIAKDLQVLTSHRELWEAANGLSLIDTEALEYEFLVFARSNDIYDHIRLIDDNGKEFIRVNIKNGKPALVKQENLQDKSERYYFKDTFNLDKGEIFVSPFDLNIEAGEIELPYKPTIRFGMPVFDLNENKRGVVILNYLGIKLLKRLKKAALDDENEGYDILVNSDGYFLKGLSDDDEWGFMFNERKNKTFSNMFNEASTYINNNEKGQILTKEGMFTFDTLYPLYEGLESSSGSSEAFGQSVEKLGADKYYWKLISFVPKKAIQSLTDKFESLLIMFNTILIIIIIISTWFISKVHYSRQQFEKKLEKMAHYDPVTELPNRSMLFDRMKIALAIAKREKVPLYIFFIDLDGFKKVNDEMGHDAGDYVLAETAKRLLSCVRIMDTVARIGGDEFVMIIKSGDGQKNIDQIATRVIKELSKTILYKDKSCNIGCSIGIANYPKDGEVEEELLNKADTAMYEVKNAGKNGFKYVE